MKIVDTKGHLCPKPLIMLKKALKEAKENDSFCVVTDNDIASCNIEDYLKELGYMTDIRKTENAIEILFTISSVHMESNLSTLQREECPVNLPKLTENDGQPYIIVIKSDKMGDGQEEIGKLLMKGFINAIEEMDRLPDKIICYNSGVLNVIEGTETAHTLYHLEKDFGVEVLVCGLCADYYAIKDRIGAGKITNMYKILDIQRKAIHIIYP